MNLQKNWHQMLFLRDSIIILGIQFAYAIKRQQQVFLYLQCPKGKYEASYNIKHHKRCDVKLVAKSRNQVTLKCSLKHQIIFFNSLINSFLICDEIFTTRHSKFSIQQRNYVWGFYYDGYSYNNPAFVILIIQTSQILLHYDT